MNEIPKDKSASASASFPASVGGASPSKGRAKPKAAEQAHSQRLSLETGAVDLKIAAVEQLADPTIERFLSLLARLLARWHVQQAAGIEKTPAIAHGRMDAQGRPRRGKQRAQFDNTLQQE